MSDDDQPPRGPPPIRGAPDDAPRPPFPSESVTPKTDVTEPERPQVAHSLPGPNGIAGRIEFLKERERHGAKIALESRLEIAKLLVVMYDQHGYKGQRYEEFAKAHGIKERDANSLYLLGKFADDILAECEVNARKHGANYEWPSWRQARTAWKIKNRSGAVADDGVKTEDADEAEEDGDSETPAADPVIEVVHERDTLKDQVSTLSMQFKQERARREETEDKRADEQRRHNEALTVLHEVVATAKDAQVELQQKLDTAQETLTAEQQRIAALTAQLAEREAAFQKLEAAYLALLAKVQQEPEPPPPEPKPEPSPEPPPEPSPPEPEEPEPSPEAPAVSTVTTDNMLAILDVLPPDGAPIRDREIYERVGWQPRVADDILNAMQARGLTELSANGWHRVIPTPDQPSAPPPEPALIMSTSTALVPVATPQPAPRRRRGRPKGSLNKTKK
jgi:hypothetical protein